MGIFALTAASRKATHSAVAPLRRHCTLSNQRQTFLRAMHLKGEIFRYGSATPQVAFQSGQHKRHLILVHGLEDGLLSLPYCYSLAAALDGNRWSLVQAQLRSSYQGYGISSLDQDAEDLFTLAAYLKAERSCEEVVIMGNSTGCQDSVRFVKLYGKSTDIPPLRGVILQAPVSDQESLAVLPKTKSRIQEALKMKEAGKAKEILFRDFDSMGEAVTAERFLDLAQERGDDDMFSTYLSDTELAALHRHMNGVKCLMLLSGKDEYVPDHVDKELLGKRLAAAMGSTATYQVIEEADHKATSHQSVIVAAVMTFLA